MTIKHKTVLSAVLAASSLRLAACCLVLMCLPLSLAANGLLQIDAKGLSAAHVESLYESAREGLAAQNRAKLTSSSSGISSVRKLIVVNPDVQTNVVLTFADSKANVKITEFLLAELRNFGLGDATGYDCFEVEVRANGDLTLLESDSVAAPGEVKLPSFRYGRRGNLRMASPAERQLKTVSLDVPTPIFADDVTAEERARIWAAFRQKAAADGVYRYEYELPNGDLTTYSDDSSIGDSEIADNETTVGNFRMIDWVDSSSGTTAATTTQMAPIKAGAQTWDAVLGISHPVCVKVGFASLSAGVLGSSSSPPTYTMNGIQYPAALIDQLMGDDMHPSYGYDIRIRYSTNFTFYYGTDGNCPSSKHDLQSIVTHELCHGLGFTSYHYRGSDGETPDGTWKSGVPSIFDTFLYYGSGRLPNLTQSTRRTAFTSQALYWDGSNAKTANGGSRIKMYAPSVYDGGSSVSHWDDSVTFTTFMKYSTSCGEVRHAVDTRLIGAFKDMGWPMHGALANDNFASATVISGASGATTGSNVGATSQTGEPLLNYKASATTTVWWKWTAPAAGSVQIDTIGTSFDTVLGIYTGSSVTALTGVAQDDDGGGDRTSKCTFNCTAGTTYYICVAGYNGATGTITLNWLLTAAKTLSSVAISGSSSVTSGNQTTYTCTATYSDKSTATVTATWSFSTATYYASIGSSTGILTASAVTSPQSVTVKASYTEGGVTKTATKTVTITPPAVTLSSIAISGVSSVTSGSQTTYTCTATYSDGTAKSVSPTWSITSGSTYATISALGVLTAKTVTSSQSVTIKASYTEGGVTKTATKTVTITPPAVTLSSVAISGASSVTSGSQTTYTCTATYSDGTAKSVSPTWSITSGSTYATISALGVLTANTVTSSQSVTIKASYTEGGVTKTATKTVAIAPASTTVHTLTIPAAGGTGYATSFTIQTGGSYYRACTPPSWITSINNAIKSSGYTISSGSGAGTTTLQDSTTFTVTVSASANTTGATRSWDYLITGPENHTVRITQESQAVSQPTVTGDAGATVTGDATSGYVVKPSSGKTSVEVVLPSGLDPSKVTVEVGTEVKTLILHGAWVKIMNAGYDITDYLDVPAAVGGVIDLSQAKVKESIVKDALDTTKSLNPAVVVLTSSSPSIRTAKTKPGLTYTFSEGTTLGGLTQKAVKVGDGNAWTPTVSVKGGESGFYSIGVTK